MTVAEKKRYRRPTVYREVEVSISEFSTDELRAELAHRRHQEIDGATHDGCEDEDEVLTPETVNRLRTLILCGQRDAALRELCSELEPWVGRLMP